MALKKENPSVNRNNLLVPGVPNAHLAYGSNTISAAPSGIAAGAFTGASPNPGFSSVKHKYKKRTRSIKDVQKFFVNKSGTTGPPSSAPAAPQNGAGSGIGLNTNNPTNGEMTTWTPTVTSGGAISPGQSPGHKAKSYAENGIGGAMNNVAPGGPNLGAHREDKGKEKMSTPELNESNRLGLPTASFDDTDDLSESASHDGVFVTFCFFVQILIYLFFYSFPQKIRMTQKRKMTPPRSPSRTVLNPAERTLPRAKSTSVAPRRIISTRKRPKF